MNPSFQFCVPPNPIVKMLRLRADLNLHKLRTCRNIAGMKRQLDPYAAATDTTSGMPTIGSSGQLVVPGAAPLRPTPYRYAVLIDRAKQSVQIAVQMEGAMLSALVRGEDLAQTMLQTKQQLRLAEAGVRLQDLRVGEATHSVELAELQRERAHIQKDAYDRWLQLGNNQYEEQMLEAYEIAAAAQVRSADATNLIQSKQSLIASAQLAAQVAAADGGGIAGGV